MDKINFFKKSQICTLWKLYIENFPGWIRCSLRTGCDSPTRPTYELEGGLRLVFYSVPTSYTNKVINFLLYTYYVNLYSFYIYSIIKTRTPKADELFRTDGTRDDCRDIYGALSKCLPDNLFSFSETRVAENHLFRSTRIYFI